MFNLLVLLLAAFTERFLGGTIENACSADPLPYTLDDYKYLY